MLLALEKVLRILLTTCAVSVIRMHGSWNMHCQWKINEFYIIKHVYFMYIYTFSLRNQYTCIFVHSFWETTRKLHVLLAFIENVQSSDHMSYVAIISSNEPWFLVDLCFFKTAFQNILTSKRSSLNCFESSKYSRFIFSQTFVMLY